VQYSANLQNASCNNQNKTKFTARYELSPYITWLRFVLRGLNFGSVNRESALSLCSFLLCFKTQWVQNTVIAWSAFYTSYCPWHICSHIRRCKQSAGACYSQLYQFPRSLPYDNVHPAGADVHLLQVPRFSNLLPNSFHHIQKWFLFLFPELLNMHQIKFADRRNGMSGFVRWT
jgi:hypothetical protein